MKHNDRIAGMCLYGFILSERPAERTRCMNKIEQTYGRPIALIVRDMVENSGRDTAG